LQLINFFLAEVILGIKNANECPELNLQFGESGFAYDNRLCQGNSY